MEANPKVRPTNAKEKGKTRKPKPLIDPNNQLLSVNEVLNRILKEADSLPSDIRQTLVSARDEAWRRFVEERERLNSATR